MLTRLLALLTALLMLAHVLTGCGGAEERKAAYLERGRKYFAEHNYDKAKVEFKNVLQIDPKTAKPYFYLGQIEEDRQNWREAFAYYQMAVELDTGDLEAKVKLAKFYLLANQKQKGSELVEAILQARPDEVEARMLKAGIANIEGKRDDAIAQLERLTAEHPTRSDVYVLLAMLHMQKNEAQAAVRVLQQGIEKTEGNPALLLNLAKLEMQQNRPEKAEEILKRLIAAEPGKLEHRGMLANLYIQLRRSNEAEDVLRAAIQADPKDARRYALLAEFFLKTDRQDQAVAEMVRAVKVYPEEAALRFGLAGLYEQLNQPEKAQAAYLDIVEETGSKPDVLRAQNRLAVLALANRQTDQALKLIEEVLGESPQDSQALLLQGRIALARKEPQKAISSFRAILKDQPESVEVLTLLASAHLLDAKPALAQESLEKAVAAKPDDFHASKRLVEFLVQQKNFAAALEKVNDYLKLQPRSLDGLNLKADVLALNDNQPELEAVLVQMKEDFPDRAIGAFRLGQFYQKQKKYDAALSEYEASLKRSDNDYEPLKSIVGVYLAMQQPNKALARLKKVIAEKPRHPSAHQLLALYYVSRKQDDEAVKALKQAIETNPRWVLPYVNLAGVYEGQGQPGLAIATYDAALKVFPEDPALMVGLARLHELSKDYAAAIRQYEAILSKYPDNLLAANNLASLLSMDAGSKSNLERALKLAKPLEHSDEPIFMDTLAWIWYQTGEYDKALPLMQKVIEKAAHEPVFQYHIGMVYSKKGDQAMAKEHLKNAIDSGKPFVGLDEAKEILVKL
jgi:tetratricopeptide (TPR) repeat protein